MAESEDELESFDEGERGEWLDSQDSKTKIITFVPITSWQIDGQKVETVTDFIFSDSKITDNSDCSHEIKIILLLGSEAMTNLDGVLKKQKHHSADKDSYRQSYGFSGRHVQM